MRAYIIKRLLLAIPTLVLVTIIIFFTIRLIPGDVIDMMAEQQSFVTGASIETLKHELGLDVPITTQYGRWIWEFLQGDLGDSLWTGRPVILQIIPRIPISFELGILALVISQIIALPIGIFSAIRQDTMGDYIGRSIAIICIALPSFWLGTIVMVYPAIWWNWSPSMEYISFAENPLKNITMFIIPAIILGMVLSGTTMRMTRTMMLEVLRQDYIRTAWAKGLKEKVVIIRHALKNALIPVVTIIGLQVPVLIGGSVILENIFNLPGIGSLTIKVIEQRDYTVLSGVNLIIASLVLITNIIIDIAYSYLDPRIKYR